MGLALTITKDDRHVGLRDAESLGYFGLRHGAFQPSDLGDLFGTEQFLEERNAADIDGMLSISLIRCPFQIGGRTVSFASIDMIDDRKVERVGDECQCHQSVNVDRFGASVSKEIDIRIPKFVRAGSENLAVYSSGFQAIADAVQASDAANIADLVEVSKVGDCNGSPFFCDVGIHVTGCLSGEVGLAIKDPSHARTFGGSVHYGRALNYLQ